MHMQISPDVVRIHIYVYVLHIDCYVRIYRSSIYKQVGRYNVLEKIAYTGYPEEQIYYRPHANIRSVAQMKCFRVNYFLMQYPFVETPRNENQVN